MNIINNRDKIISVLLGAGCIVTIATAVVFYFLKENLKKENGTLLIGLQELSSNKARLEKLNEELEKSKRSLEQSLKNSEENAKKVSSMLEEEKKRAAQLSDQVKQEGDEIMKLKASIAKYKEERRVLLTRLEMQTKSFNETAAELSALTKSKKEDEEKIRELSRKLEGLTKGKDTASLGSVIIKD